MVGSSFSIFVGLVVGRALFRWFANACLVRQEIRIELLGGISTPGLPSHMLPSRYRNYST